MANPSPRASRDPEFRPIAPKARRVLRDLMYRNVVDLGFERDVLAVGTATLLDEHPAPQLPKAVLLVPGDDVPLSTEEVEAAFRDCSVTSLPWIQQAAAVLDARRTPMTAEEIESFLAGLTTHREKLGRATGKGRAISSSRMRTGGSR
ncbi:hypothetical protein WME99_05585 [Sorangium sp. So ce136]|uniref:hypothetical protein n=1 Tax=Sorangium sp. So ce136 TaxID=3133284 RepID=UPI003F103CDA